MKILFYGAGVMGCTYGWQLSKAGYDVSLFVRKGKKQTLEENGIPIHCTDLRDRKKVVQDVIFRPEMIDTLTVDNDFDYIVVTTNHLNLDDVLTDLKETAGKASILFLQNVWSSDMEKIKAQLSPEQYFFGFPFMAGGGRDEKGIHSIISGSTYSCTMLGEATGEVTPRVKRIATILSDANMKPFISTQIITWLIPHYAFLAGISAGIITKGNMSNFLKDSRTVKNSILAIRESFHVCEAMGIDPKKEKVNKLYYLPLFVSSFVVRKVFSDDALQAMIDGYLKNASYEIKGMIENIIQSAKAHNIETPYLTTFEKEIKQSLTEKK